MSLDPTYPLFNFYHPLRLIFNSTLISFSGPSLLIYFNPSLIINSHPPPPLPSSPPFRPFRPFRSFRSVRSLTFSRLLRRRFLAIRLSSFVFETGEFRPFPPPSFLLLYSLTFTLLLPSIVPSFLPSFKYPFGSLTFSLLLRRPFLSVRLSSFEFDAGELCLLLPTTVHSRRAHL